MNNDRSLPGIEFATKSMNHLHSVVTDSISQFAIGDSVWFSFYYEKLDRYEKMKEDKTTNLYMWGLVDITRTQVYRIADESLVELKREKDLRFKVYPSPAREFVNVRVDVSKSDPGTVVLFNTRGEILEENESYDVTQATNIQLEPYPSGTYYIQVTFKGENFIKKIIKK